jgi:hypothetical protein
VGKRYSDAAIVKALRQHRGLIVPAADALGCDQMTIRRRVKDVPAVAEAMHEARAALVDLAEARLYEAVDAGESWAVALVVRTLGRDRGYGDQVALTGAGGGPLAMAHSLDDPQARLRERLQAVHERLTAAHQIEQAG